MAIAGGTNVGGLTADAAVRGLSDTPQSTCYVATDSEEHVAEFPVTCTKCGYQLKDENETPCPECGDSRRTVHMSARMQSTSSARVSTTVRRIEEEIRKNWPLLTVLIACDVLSVVPAYFLSGWASVAITVFFIALSTVLGYYAITRVITITSETK